MFSPETAQIDVFRKDLVFECSGVRRSAKTGADRLDWMRCAFFRIYSGFFYNFSTANAQIWIFLKIFKCKGMFFSFSFDSLLSRGSRDVFTGFLARSVQKLWVMTDQKFIGHCGGRRGREVTSLMQQKRRKTQLS